MYSAGILHPAAAAAPSHNNMCWSKVLDMTYCGADDMMFLIRPLRSWSSVGRHTFSMIWREVSRYCGPRNASPATLRFSTKARGTCARDTTNGSITFPGFLAELGADKSVGAWRFAPDHAKVEEGATLNLQSLAGETHTFTRVKRFGGGFVAFLNTASGNLTPAPKCAQMVNGNLGPQPPSADNIFIPAGGSAGTTLDHGEVARFQCCIHPWMRLTITPKDEHHEEVR